MDEANVAAVSVAASENGDSLLAKEATGSAWRDVGSRMHLNETSQLEPGVKAEKTEVADDIITDTSPAATPAPSISTLTTESTASLRTDSPECRGSNSVESQSCDTVESVTVTSRGGELAPTSKLRGSSDSGAASGGKALDCSNGSDSAVETDESQDELLIASEDVKVENESEVEEDEGALDSVDGVVLERLSHLSCKPELVDGLLDEEDSNSCCSLSSLSGAFLTGESDACMRQRLFTSLSQSFPDSKLSRILHAMDTQLDEPEDEFSFANGDKLSSSCFAQIRCDKGPGDLDGEDDDELTSLAWLQDADLLKNINAGEDDPLPEEKENAADGGVAKTESVGGGGGGFVPQAHPPHVPYNPLKHVNSKPPYSFSCLIFMAIEESPEKRLPVKDIYNWILTHFPYFQNAPTGWKNSVRHNLSLNKCFKKVEKDKGTSIGKGSLWCIDPDYRPNLLQALRKTPYHPYHQLQMMSSVQPQQQIQHIQGLPPSFRPMPLSQRFIPNTVSPHLFPFLSRRLAQTGLEYIDREIQDVANTLVAMKGLNLNRNSSALSDDPQSNGRNALKRMYNGVTKRSAGPVIVTAAPSEDHTYCLIKAEDDDDISGTSSIDNEYDFGDDDDCIDDEDVDDDESDNVSELSHYPSDWDIDEVDGAAPSAPLPQHNGTSKRARLENKRKMDADKDEEEKQEGAKLLLSLAGIANFEPKPEKKQDAVSSSRRKPALLSSGSRKTVAAASGSQSSKSSKTSKKSTSAAVSKGSSSLSSSQSSSSSRASSKSSRVTTGSKAQSRASASSTLKVKLSTSKLSHLSAVKEKASSAPPSPKTLQAKTKPNLPASVPAGGLKLNLAASAPAGGLKLKSIIQTRRGKAAAEAAAAAAVAASTSTTTSESGASRSGMCTRGKKLGKNLSASFS